MSSIQPHWNTDQKGEHALKLLADKIRQEGKGKDFDCIIGLSGGLDSSYVAFVVREKMGLRPLLFHVDAGWNTDQAVGNIEKLVDGLGLDLYTEVNQPSLAQGLAAHSTAAFKKLFARGWYAHELALLANYDLKYLFPADATDMRL